MTIPYVYILLEYVRGGRLMFPGVPWVRWAQGKGLGQGSGVGLVSPTPLNLWHITENFHRPTVTVQICKSANFHGRVQICTAE